MEELCGRGPNRRAGELRNMLGSSALGGGTRGEAVNGAGNELLSKKGDVCATDCEPCEEGKSYVSWGLLMLSKPWLIAGDGAKGLTKSL